MGKNNHEQSGSNRGGNKYFGGRGSGARGGFFGGPRKSFSGGGGGRDFGSRSSERPAMHKANCADCGQECEVPFRPSGGRPVFCNSCFKKRGNESGERPYGKSFERPRLGDEQADRQMFDATCAKCGRKCQVPFRSNSDRPAYCNQCFNNRSDSRQSGGENHGGSNQQFEIINAKLDKILRVLIPTVTAPQAATSVGKKDDAKNQKNIPDKIKTVSKKIKPKKNK